MYYVWYHRHYLLLLTICCYAEQSSGFYSPKLVFFNKPNVIEFDKRTRRCSSSSLTSVLLLVSSKNRETHDYVKSNLLKKEKDTDFSSTKKRKSKRDGKRSNNYENRRINRSNIVRRSDNLHRETNMNEKPWENTIVIMYNKPPNVVTSHANSDLVETGRITVYDDIMSMKGYLPQNVTTSKKNVSFLEVTGIHSKLHAIGRLDADTTGLLLLTNDGGLVHHVTNPTASSHINGDHDKIPKTYEALIMGYHTLPLKDANNFSIDDMKNESINHVHNDDTSSSLLTLLNEGVDIGSKYGGKTLPAQSIAVLSHPTRKSTLVRITIVEGKNRQIRRMFHAVGSGVMKLHRCRVGNIELDDCMIGKEGSWRLLTDDEVWKGLGWKVRKII